MHHHAVVLERVEVFGGEAPGCYPQPADRYVRHVEDSIDLGYPGVLHPVLLEVAARHHGRSGVDVELDPVAAARQTQMGDVGQVVGELVASMGEAPGCW